MIVFAVLATVAVGVLLDLDWKLGFVAGSTAPAGDLFSSFIKRRLGMPASSMAHGLDQIPRVPFSAAGVQQLVGFGNCR